MTKKISKHDGNLLLELARESIFQEFKQQDSKIESLKKKVSSQILNEMRGTFVTLHQNKQLRGCIGNIEPVKKIFNGICDNAKHSAFNDSRFTPLSSDELDQTDIEISILTKPEKVDYSDSNDLIAKLRPGIDGVIIQKDHNNATFLPQVWEQLKTPELFLSHLCTKAGLSANEWKSGKLEVSIYQVQLFEES